MVAGAWIGLGVMDRALPEPGEGGFIPFLIAGIVGLWVGAILGAALVTNLKGSGGIRSALYSFWIVPVTAVVLGVPSLWLLPDSLDSPLTLFVFPIAAGIGCSVGRAMWLWREDREIVEA
jgi:hypothetical protein